MQNKVKVLFPPILSVEGFDQESLREIAEGKIKELGKENRRVEKVARLKEDIPYDALDNEKKYSVPWLESMMYLYGLESDRDKYRMWIRYWQRVGNLYTPPKFEGRISDYDIEKAKDYPIQDLLDTPCRNAGSGKLKALCCFHEEKIPSFIIYTNENSAHCFGCQKHIRSAIDFVMERDNLEFKEAVRKLI